MSSKKTYIDNLSDLPERDILDNLLQVYYFYLSSDSKEKMEYRNYLKRIFEKVGKSTAIKELLIEAKKYKGYNKKLDFPDMLKYGVEIEVANINILEIQNIFEDGTVQYIFNALDVPEEISNLIIKNSVFANKIDAPDKWVFSEEASTDESEASSPIMYNGLNDLNQINAICLLFKALGGKIREDTGLHINIGVEFLECNEKALEYLLKIWGECEELFFKVANSEGEIIRPEARLRATPIKDNIQDFFEKDGSITLKTKEDFEKFLFLIQARHHMDRMMDWVAFDLGDEYSYLEDDYYLAKSEDEICEIYRKYHQATIAEKVNNPVRWTSINFNHMKWNDEEPGRIEFRIFNSSLDIETILEDLVLVGKICYVSLELAKNPNYKKEVLDQLFRHDLSENEKLNLMLELLFDEIEQRMIYKKRWESIHRDEAYENLRSGRDTFKR